MSWLVTPEHLPMPRLDAVVVGTVRLTTPAGAAIWALHVRSPALPEHGVSDSADYAIYWERNGSPPFMRWLYLARDADGWLVLDPSIVGNAPLPPRSL